MQRAQTVDIVIVNWNSGVLLRRCVASIGCLSRVNYTLDRVTVVDNASTDDSASALGASVDLVRNCENRGFGRASNQGARLGNAELLLFLNPDVMLEPDSLTAAVSRLNDDPTIHAIGIRLLDDAGAAHRSCCRIPTVRMLLAHSLGTDRVPLFARTGYAMREWAHEDTRFVDHVIGAFYLVRRRVFERLDGFDERFFVYLEDLDLSNRIKASGGRCLYIADGFAHHVGGGTTRAIKARRLFYSLRSRLQYTAKHHGWVGLVPLGAATLIVEPLVRLVAALLQRSWTDVKAIAGAYGLVYRSIGRRARELVSQDWNIKTFHRRWCQR